MKKVAILLLLAAFMIFLGCTPPECPASCDDNNTCTEDTCSADTGYRCNHAGIEFCCGNGECVDGETFTTCPEDCADCNDWDKCTHDDFDYEKQVCVNERMAPCCGNLVCEEIESRESCSEDCWNFDMRYDTALRLTGMMKEIVENHPAGDAEIDEWMGTANAADAELGDLLGEYRESGTWDSAVRFLSGSSGFILELKDDPDSAVNRPMQLLKYRHRALSSYFDITGRDAADPEVIDMVQLFRELGDSSVDAESKLYFNCTSMRCETVEEYRSSFLSAVLDII